MTVTMADGRPSAGTKINHEVFDIQAEPHVATHPDPDENLRWHGGHLYVVEFSTGIIKVGRANKVEQRMKTHGNGAALHLASIARSWVSRRHLNFIENEERLIFSCREIYGEPFVGKEAFKDADFEGVRYMAECLPLQTVADTATPEVLVALWQKAEAIVRRVDDLGMDACREAMFEIVEQIARLTPAPWRESDPYAAANYLLAKSDNIFDLYGRANHFERSARALFVLYEERWPVTFEEMVEWLDSRANDARLMP